MGSLLFPVFAVIITGKAKKISYLPLSRLTYKKEVKVFKVGQLVVFGNNGVCRVEKIGVPDLAGVPVGVDYYTLAPYYQNGSRIFTPCDNNKIVMRPVLTKEEAQNLLKEISSIGLLTVIDERKREETYKEVMKSCDCRKFVSVIKTIRKRKEERIQEGRKITTSDEKYIQMAEDKLYGELAIALEIEKKDVKEVIEQNISC